MTPTPVDRSEHVGRMLLGLADLLDLATLKLREFGSELIERSKQTTSKQKDQIHD